MNSIISDSAGGALIGWLDYRSGIQDVYMQRVSTTGTPYPGWPTDGLRVCGEPGARYGPLLCTDGAGGAIIAWTDRRAGNSDIYAQHVLGTGALDPSWPMAGLPVCSDSSDQREVSLCADGAGGALVSWTDPRESFGNIYVQHARDGVTLWALDGIKLSGAPGIYSQDKSRIVLTASRDTAMVVWRHIGAWYAPYVQQLLPTGDIGAGWPNGGLCLNTTENYGSTGPSMTPDGTGGAYAAWSARYDLQGSEFIYCQHITSEAQWAPGWPEGGLRVCSATGGQSNPRTGLLPNREVLVAWSDGRAGDSDIFAGAVTEGGVVPARFARVNTEVNDTGVHLQWYGTEYAGSMLYLFRAIAEAGPTMLSEVPANSSGLVTYDDDSVPRGSTIHYWLRTEEDTGASCIDSLSVYVPAHGLTLECDIVPNPTSGPVTLRLAGPMVAPFTIECVDVMGRRVLARTILPGARAYELVVTQTTNMDSGVYIVTVAQGPRSVVRRMVVLH